MTYPPSNPAARTQADADPLVAVCIPGRLGPVNDHTPWWLAPLEACLRGLEEGTPLTIEALGILAEEGAAASLAWIETQACEWRTYDFFGRLLHGLLLLDRGRITAARVSLAPLTMVDERYDWIALAAAESFIRSDEITQGLQLLAEIRADTAFAARRDWVQQLAYQRQNR